VTSTFLTFQTRTVAGVFLSLMGSALMVQPDTSQPPLVGHMYTRAYPVMVLILCLKM
jgi:hypothetical protein